jgi:RNA polymerase sigma factor (sigma-70 family)
MTANEDRPVPADPPPQRAPSPAEVPDSLAMRAAWIDFYDAHYHRVVRLLMRDGGRLEDASDAAAEAFLESWKLMNGQPEVWSQVQNKPSWIFAVAWRKYKRPPGARRRPLIADHTEIPDFADPALEPGELTAQTQGVLHALQGLDDEARAVMAFRIDHIPVSIIADTLGITEQRVRDVTKKARATLKRTLDIPGTPKGRDPQ